MLLSTERRFPFSLFTNSKAELKMFKKSYHYYIHTPSFFSLSCDQYIQEALFVDVAIQTFLHATENPAKESDSNPIWLK